MPPTGWPAPRAPWAPRRWPSLAPPSNTPFFLAISTGCPLLLPILTARSSGSKPTSPVSPPADPSAAKKMPPDMGRAAEVVQEEAFENAQSLLYAAAQHNESVNLPQQPKKLSGTGEKVRVWQGGAESPDLILRPPGWRQWRQRNSRPPPRIRHSPPPPWWRPRRRRRRHWRERRRHPLRVRSGGRRSSP